MNTNTLPNWARLDLACPFKDPGAEWNPDDKAGNGSYTLSSTIYADQTQVLLVAFDPSPYWWVLVWNKKTGIRRRSVLRYEFAQAANDYFFAVEENAAHPR